MKQILLEMLNQIEQNRRSAESQVCPLHYLFMLSQFGRSSFIQSTDSQRIPNNSVLADVGPAAQVRQLCNAKSRLSLS
eukprot:gene4278-3095_t